MDTALVINTIAQVIKTAVEVGPTVIKTVQDAAPFAEAIVKTLLGKDPTLEELTALEEQIAALSAQLQEPLPPAEPDDI